MDDCSGNSTVVSDQIKNSSVTVRPWTSSDCEEIIRLIKELSAYEKLEDQMHLTVEELRRDGFGERPVFRCIVADKKQTDESGKSEDTDALAGYALFYYKYSTWEGRCIYLEDLYVTPDCRKKGIGLALFKSVAKIAVEERCKRIDFTVLGWNETAIEFYKKMNAIDLTQTEQWHFFRLNDNEIKQLANSTD